MNKYKTHLQQYTVHHCNQIQEIYHTAE